MSNRAIRDIAPLNYFNWDNYSVNLSSKEDSLSYSELFG